MPAMNDSVRNELAAPLPAPLQIFLMSEGTTIATALSLAAELGVADLLADGPRRHEELALKTSTHARSLYRVLRLLSSVGVFTEVDPGCFGLTALGECLRSGVPGSMRSWLRMVGLQNCRAALPPAGRLLLVESVVPPGDEAHPSKLMDFVMLTALGGRERTKEEFDQLLVEAGFQVNRVISTDSPMSIIEASLK